LLRAGEGNKEGWEGLEEREIRREEGKREGRAGGKVEK
jgi:hypothetical protein